MKKFWKGVLESATLGVGALVASAPADAGVSVGIHIGVPAPAYYYGPGFYPPGPCDAYNYYYTGDCGYAMYDGPIYLDGAYVTGPHYYRWYNGAPMFWYRGGWHSWNGWRGVNYGWNRYEGYGWHGGRWDRGWGRTHWANDRARYSHEIRRDNREIREDRRDIRNGRDELRYDRHHDVSHAETRRDERDLHQDRREYREDRRDRRNDHHHPH